MDENEKPNEPEERRDPEDDPPEDDLRYERPPEVEAQILEVRDLDRAGRLARAAIRPGGADGYLFDETVVFLIRDAFRAGDGEAVEALYEVLYDRSLDQLIPWANRVVPANDVDDVVAEVALVVFRLLIAEGSRGDFAEAKFGRFLKKRSLDVLRKYWRARKIDVVADSIDEDEDDPEAPPRLNLAAGGATADELVLIGEALAVLDEDRRTVFLLYHRDGYKIDSDDPSEVTISGMMGVTEKTVRNWLKRCANELRDVLYAKE